MDFVDFTQIFELIPNSFFELHTSFVHIFVFFVIFLPLNNVRL